MKVVEIEKMGSVVSRLVLGRAISVTTESIIPKVGDVVAVRALSTRELTAANAMRVTMREANVGFLNGIAFGVLTGIAAGGWFQSPGIGVVIALAMVINLFAGALGGILIPLMLDRLGYDPAVASGAFVTTVTDVVGNFAFLGIATLWFHLA